MTPVTTCQGTLGPFSQFALDAKVQVQEADAGLIPRSSMKKLSSRRIFRYVGAAVVLVLCQRGWLEAQQAQIATAFRLSDESFSSSSESASLASLPAAPSAVAAESGALKWSGAVPAASMAVVAAPVRPAEPSSHHFWDRQNCVLFTAVAGMATADFFVTRANLAKGGKELNPVTSVFSGSTPALAANFALETTGVIGISYMFHKTGHHKLERMTSFVNIGASAGAVGYGLSHR